jgi:proteasome lid subunit RPN8/RPN11
MLLISSELVEALVAQTKEDHPFESCGVIAGPRDSDLPMRHIRMRNAAESEDFFQFAPEEQFRVWKDMESRGEEPVVIYHSHTRSRAYPSQEDIVLATEPNAHYVIIGVGPQQDAEVRSFRIIGGEVAEEKLKIVTDYSGQFSRKHQPINIPSAA